MDLRPLSVTKMENVLASLTLLEISATKVNPDTMISPIQKVCLIFFLLNSVKFNLIFKFRV